MFSMWFYSKLPLVHNSGRCTIKPVNLTDLKPNLANHNREIEHSF